MSSGTHALKQWKNGMIQQITVEHVAFVPDRPLNTQSSLMSGLNNAAVRSAALKLYAKMIALREAVTGAKA